MAGLPSVGDAPLVQVTLAGFRSELVQPKMCKEPVTADMLRAMVDLVGQEPSLSDVRLLVLCLVAFAGLCIVMSCSSCSALILHLAQKE